jgi:hypothetical protein
MWDLVLVQEKYDSYYLDEQSPFSVKLLVLRALFFVLNCYTK